MNPTDLAGFLHDHARAVYGYCLRRCASPQDAEYVAQEILLRACRLLPAREDVTDLVRYLWTIARNTLASHYRRSARCTIGISADLAAEDDLQSDLLAQEEISRLHHEIARLSRQQREILVLHYFHGMKQTDIAQALRLPVGTVKWHLHEAKKELKLHMESTRPMEHLKFDPIRFTGFGTEGSIGEEGSPWQFFRSALCQNIAYAAWHKARTANEIADALGMSPVYVTDALDAMTEQGYMTESGGKYRCAILLTEADDHLIELADRMYSEAAALIAPALHRALLQSGLMADGSIHCCAEEAHDGNHACSLWALIPWCIANSAGTQDISFSAVASLRPDGARNVIHATISGPGTKQPALYEMMEGRFSGPCWNASEGVTLWQLDTCWSERRIGEAYHHEALTTLSRLRRFFNDEPLTREEYAMLAQQGIMRCSGEPEGMFYLTLLPVWISGKDTRKKLERICQEVYDAHREELETLQRPYAEALLASTPEHMQRLRRYMLQNVYRSDWFILHCLHDLVEAGLLRRPTEAEARSLHTVILTD